LHYRSALALTLVLAIFLTSLGLTVSVQAQTAPPNPGIEYDHFMVYQAADGDTICREATLAERQQLEQINPKNLQQFNHLDNNAVALSQPDNAVGHLTIILEGTQNLNDNAPAKAAFDRAAAAWEAVINSPVTIYVQADFGPTNFGDPWGSSTLASTSSPSVGNVAYSTVRNNSPRVLKTPRYHYI